MMKALLAFLFLFEVAVCQDCVLNVPANPLSAAGLATPYTVTGCLQTVNPSFVQAAILDLSLNTISLYNPLVTQSGVAPAVTPTVPTLPVNGYVIAIWFGTNGNTLTLAGPGLATGNCVNGLAGSIFGQFAYCNAPQFFASASVAAAAGRLGMTPLGVTNTDGLPCPTIRDFFVVDMDQSDNVNTEYLFINNQTAQNTANNRKTLTNLLTNGSDNRLLAIAMDGALGCTPFKAPDLADNMNPLTSLPLNELHAAAFQAAPVALVSLNHAMCRVNNQPSLLKVNAYRAGVNQPQAITNNDADSFTFCFNFYHTQPQRLLNNEKAFTNFGSPDINMADSLFAFLAARFNASFGANGLNCQNLLNVPPPILLTMNGNGVIVGATINPPAPLGTTTTTTNNNALIIGVVVGGVGGLILIVAVVLTVRFFVRRNNNRQYL
jgi:hypothetical protein